MKKVLKVFFYCVGFACLNLIMQIVSSIPVTIFILLLHASPHIISHAPNAIMSIDIERVIQDSILPSYILSVILTFFSAWVIHVIFKRRFWERLSFRKTSFTFITISLITGCALQMPISFIMTLIENAGIAPDMFDQYSNHMEQLFTGQNLFLQILAIGILAPILEEIIFRGLIFHQLKNNIPIALALIIQALLFGISHLNVIQGSYAVVIGIILGLSLKWSGSLLLPIVIHMGMNLSGIILSEFGANISDLASIIMLIISFLIVPLYMLFIYYKTKVKPQLYLYQARKTQ